MSGGEIGETLFNLLNAGQQQEFLTFALEVQKLTAHVASSLSLPAEHRKKNLLTEAQMGDLYFCLEERKVCMRGRKVELTAKEFDAHQLFILNPQRVMTFENIAYHVWGEDYVDVTPQAIHNLIGCLRQKLQVEPDVPAYIESVRSIGYKFADFNSQTTSK